jgi:hypothetical protein
MNEILLDTFTLLAWVHGQESLLLANQIGDLGQFLVRIGSFLTFNLVAKNLRAQLFSRSYKKHEYHCLGLGVVYLTELRMQFLPRSLM